ncbi:hypothetical protein GCM10009665_21090 [Kitasatospora nipponensis]|uniref:Transposase IS4-like domain-containing protein n=1 Tax=Kitasatospora nipponensis TaxID=258049 RepID=A0ABN1W1W5_9ACTN
MREKEGRSPEPTACVIDSQSVKTAPSVPADTQGIDAGKKIVGRKRSIVVDTLGLLLLVMVTAASVSDNDAGKQLLTRLAATHPTITKAWVDTGRRSAADATGAACRPCPGPRSDDGSCRCPSPPRPGPWVPPLARCVLFIRTTSPAWSYSAMHPQGGPQLLISGRVVVRCWAAR